MAAINLLKSQEVGSFSELLSPVVAVFVFLGVWWGGRGGGLGVFSGLSFFCCWLGL